MKPLPLRDRKDLVTRLISGVIQFKFCSKLYSLRQPRQDILQEADNIYDNVVSDNRFISWIEEDDINDLLVKQGWWDKCSDNRIKQLTNALDDYKVDLYKSYCTNPDGVKRYKVSIEQVRTILNTAFNYKYSFHNWTLHTYAESVKQRYLAMKTLYFNNKRVYSDNADFTHTTFHLIDMAVNLRTQLSFDDELLRYLVRKDPWKTLWSIGKPNQFDFNYTELSETQKLILVFSKMYENIQNSSNCPPDDVIDDDDALDGWLISQNRENEQQKMNEKVQSTLTSKQQGNTEIFLPVKNVEEAKKIDDLNSKQMKIIKKQRQALIAKKGTVKEGEFLDAKLDQQRMSNQQFKSRAQ